MDLIDTLTTLASRAQKQLGNTESQATVQALIARIPEQKPPLPGKE